MNSGDPNPVSPAFLDALQKQMGAGVTAIGLDRFIECALYHPKLGYYARKRKRVGHGPDTDFYTASSLGPVFAKLVMGTIQSRIRTSLSRFTFIEIGPESEDGIVGYLDSVPFKECRVIRHGDPLEFPSRCVVFSNELFDAQPFRRFVHQEGQWLETVVQIKDGALSEALRPPLHQLPPLPRMAPNGYTIDWPSGAHSLMERICQTPWGGLFIAFDYGLERATVLTERPQGTGRTYAGHQMGDKLLESPGERDITCHLIWEELQEILVHWEFTDIHLQRQEAFFMHHAGEVLNRMIEAAPPGFSREKQTLMELLHPDNMGHKFQVLHARRGDF